MLLNTTLRPIIAEEMGILQRGTLDSTAPLLNITVATEAWLKRFDLPPDQVTEPAPSNGFGYDGGSPG